VVAATPRLDRFPSPEPLSEQERLLRNYVAQYPEQAVRLARLRSEALRQDQLEEMNAFPGDRAPDSEERTDGRNNDTTRR